MVIASNSPRAVIIFDWDDTICPSSFVDKSQIETFSDLPLHFQNLFNELGKCAAKCLEVASKYGEVIIITNSDEGWVQFSAERFVPNMVPIIKKYRIVSARTRYERFYPNQPLCWKAAAFAHEVNEIYGDDNKMDCDDADVDKSVVSMESTDVSSDESTVSSAHPPKEIISFGDSMEERTATRIVSRQLSAIPKSVMFVSSPTPMEIIGQLHMLTNHMKFVCHHDSSLDLQISPDQARRCADSYMDKYHVDSNRCLPIRRVDGLPDGPEQTESLATTSQA